MKRVIFCAALAIVLGAATAFAQDSLCRAPSPPMWG